MQKTGTPNEYRKELKKRILEYTMGEFLNRGIKAVTMNDIARSLGISKRTVYEIYEDKEALLLDALKYHFELSEVRMKADVESCANVIELLVTFYNDQLREMANFCPDFSFDIKKYPKAQQMIAETVKSKDEQALSFFKKGVQEGYFREDVDYSIVMLLGHYTSISIIEHKLFDRYPIPHLFRNFLQLYLRGICTLKGVELLNELLGE